MFRKKCFLDMQNVKIISTSCVLVDRQFRGIASMVNKGTQQINNQNSFTMLNNAELLANFIESKIGNRIEPQIVFIPPQHITPLETHYIFNDTIFKFFLFPPKFTIQSNGVNQNLIRAFIERNILTNEEIYSNIGALGINYELFIPIEKNNNIALSLLNNNAITQGYTGVSTTLQKQCNDYLLTLKIAGADIDGKNGAYCDINFHYNINNIENISEIMSASKLDIAKSEVSNIFAKL